MPDSRENTSSREIAIEKAHATTILQIIAAKKIITSELGQNCDHATPELIAMIAQIVATNYLASANTATDSPQ